MDGVVVFHALIIGDFSWRIIHWAGIVVLRMAAIVQLHIQQHKGTFFDLWGLLEFSDVIGLDIKKIDQHDKGGKSPDPPVPGVRDLLALFF